MSKPIFSPWTVQIRYWIPLVAVLVPTYLFALMYYGAHPDNVYVNYAPAQPVAYSHALHAGQMGMDCRYCHTTVEQAGHAAIPPTATCIGCHQNVKPDAASLAPVWESWNTGKPIEWVKVHRLPDYVYFNHSVHVARGVGCYDCHGSVDKMEVVFTAESLSMGWCLDCHRNPAQFVRPVDQITNMNWHAGLSPEDRLAIGSQIVSEKKIHPPTNCSTCHR